MPKLRNKPGVVLTGPKKPVRDANLVFIACEGEKTEASYFRFPFLRNSRVKLVVVPSEGGKSSPSHVLENLKKAVEKFDLKTGDRLWAVCDVDKWHYASQIKPLMDIKISGIPVELAFSNPCFELFLYLHNAEMPDGPVESAKDMEDMLRKDLGGYSKSNLIEETYRDKVDHAITEAGKTQMGTDGLPVNPGTYVGKLVESILDMRTKRER